MLLDSLFTAEKNQPIEIALHRILTHASGHFTLTGSIALQAHLMHRNLGHPQIFGDIDMIIDTPDDLPASLVDDFICPHVHPLVKQGDLLVQLVNPQDGIRLDIFNAVGNAFLRVQHAALGSNKVFVISCEDLMAKTTSLLLKLGRGGMIAAKHARDFAVLFPLISDSIDDVWREYRNHTDPSTFRDAASYVKNLIVTHSRALVNPDYNKDITAKCPRCQTLGLFRPADPSHVFEILGYV